MNVDISPNFPPNSSWTAAAEFGEGLFGRGRSMTIWSKRVIMLAPRVEEFAQLARTRPRHSRHCAPTPQPCDRTCALRTCTAHCCDKLICGVDSKLRPHRAVRSPDERDGRDGRSPTCPPAVRGG